MDIRTNRLNKAFKASGLSQSELCDKADINKGALSSYLSGRYFPKQIALEKLSSALNVSISYLMGFDVDRSIKADYCLRVKGDSMIDANIYDGDVAFLRKDFDFIDGEIYAVCYGAEESASLKKLYKVDNKMMLQPCNSDYAAEFVDADDVVIVGECIGTYHAR